MTFLASCLKTETLVMETYCPNLFIQKTIISQDRNVSDGNLLPKSIHIQKTICLESNQLVIGVSE